MVMLPSQVQRHLAVLFNAGSFPYITVGAPSNQGAGVAGTQGAGVKTPRAAEVAEITVGFVGAEHMPNGGMFTVGL